MKTNRNYIWLIISCGVVFITLIGFSLRKDVTLNSLNVEIAAHDGNMFITETEVVELMRGKENILSLPVSKWDMSEMERRVEANPFVQDAQVYRDVKGNVLVKVSQRKPIARIYSTQDRDRYVDEAGNLLPTTGSYTARVPLIELKGLTWEKNLNETEYGTSLHQMLLHIESNPFWRAQIAHLFVNKNGEIDIIPQVTRQKILFGTPEDYEGKLDKLMLFYKRILPVKGWNTYSTVNLKYKDQIICE
jgi:cell division protein FtsQ